MRWPFKKWCADAVLSGYYHIYERLLVDGIPYFVNGAGGAWISDFGEIDAHSMFRYREDHGALLVDATDIWIKFLFVNRKGRLVDEYVMMKERKKEAVGRETLGGTKPSHRSEPERQRLAM